jgi:hypothetical protein
LCVFGTIMITLYPFLGYSRISEETVHAKIPR